MSKAPDGVDRPSLNTVARRVLLDSLEALSAQADAVTVVGAQAVYLRSVEVELAVATFTSDADLGIDPTRLGDRPLVEQAMTAAGFVRRDQPGQWVKAERIGEQVVDIAVDLLVPERFAGSGTRSVQMPPHDRMAARRVDGLEAAVVDFDRMDVASLDAADPRVLNTRVAGPAALMIAKSYKIVQRAGERNQHRLDNKDAGDVVRLMLAVDEDQAARRFDALLRDGRTEEVTSKGLEFLRSLFGGARTPGTEMAIEALAADPIRDQIRLIAPSYLRALLGMA